MRNAKLLVLAAVSVVACVGCTIESHSMVKEVAYDFSDYDYYDKPFAPSPNYREEAPAIYTSRAITRDAGPSAVPAKAEVTKRPSAPKPGHVTIPAPKAPLSVHAASAAAAAR